MGYGCHCSQGTGLSYGSSRILKKIDLTVPEGRFAVLLGENGAGKSTLMRMMATVDFPTKGEIQYNGKDIFAMDEE